MFFSLAFAASLVASVTAHATFQAMWVNGVDQGSWCVRLPQSNSPVTSVTSNDIACNANANAASGLCAVSPGDTVTVEMHQQPGDRSCANEAIGGDHYGPINIYMAPVSNAASAVGYEQSWFKINEMGMPSNNPDFWATEVMNDNCGHVTFTIPANIAPGNYLLRAEVIALHVASSVGGAQFYMSCFQLQVGGSGSVTPAGVKFPGAYSASDPGILINIYTQLNTYQIPGPTPFASASPTVATTAWPTTATWNTASQPSTIPTTAPPNAPAAPSQSTAPANTPSSPSTPVSGPTSTAPASTPTSPAAGTVAQYGQCGGQGWTGATVCVSPFTCHALNAYYSQCY
ncbi:glycosyl hydrolase family 61-domain-containing protein [Irpex rosettiformis]|uniref:Glycosyl hydrolase family 61-domain-containing protein n=1 Tax=Irpex rosettiformis TaxID=378272 RepID=A0ACB8U8G9_9APHY|nr:glycosyl hydrolase family 61-domain-containing protein [Irpex rosettiformis]